MKHAIAFGIVSLLAGGPLAHAQDVLGDWRFAGFGTLGAAVSNTSDAEFLRDIVQPRGTTRTVDGRLDSRLGLQASGPITTTLHATIQVVSKYKWDATFAPELTWALLSWDATPDLQIRGGRLGYDVFLNADSRDVGFSYLWARPPVEHFGPLPLSHLDGMDISQSVTLGSASLRFKAYAGVASEKMPAGFGTLLDLSGSRLYGLVAEGTWGAWRGRLSGSYFKPRHNFVGHIGQIQSGLNTFGAMLGDSGLAASAEGMNLQDKTIRFFSGGLSYDEGGLQFQAVAGRFDSNATPVPNNWSGFISAGYRFGNVVPYAYWSRIVSERANLYTGMLPMLPMPEAQQLLQALDAYELATQNDQRTFALGARWDFAAQACLKIQTDSLHAHHATALWSKVKPGWNGKATVVSVVVDFIF